MANKSERKIIFATDTTTSQHYARALASRGIDSRILSVYEIKSDYMTLDQIQQLIELVGSVTIKEISR